MPYQRSYRTQLRATAYGLIVAVLLGGCSDEADTTVAPIVRHALSAYSIGSIEELSNDVDQLEAVGTAAGSLSPVQRKAFDAAARLRALKALLWTRPPFQEQFRLAYAEHLCARRSWADEIAPQFDDTRQDDKDGRPSNEAIGCEGATSALTRWRWWLILSNPFAYVWRANQTNNELLRNGFVQPSPHKAAGFSRRETVKLRPLSPMNQ